MSYSQHNIIKTFFYSNLCSKVIEKKLNLSPRESFMKSGQSPLTGNIPAIRNSWPTVLAATAGAGNALCAASRLGSRTQHLRGTTQA